MGEKSGLRERELMFVGGSECRRRRHQDWNTGDEQEKRQGGVGVGIGMCGGAAPAEGAEMSSVLFCGRKEGRSPRTT